MALVFGFGKTRGAAVSAILVMGPVSLWERKNREKACPGGLGRYPANVICANWPEVDSCQGDSGAPMLFNCAQIGVVSRGDGCAQPRKPGIYVKIAPYLTSIEKQIGSSPRRR